MQVTSTQLNIKTKRDDFVELSRYLNNSKGFTLVELLISIAIIGILAAVGIPQYTQYKIRGYDAHSKQALREMNFTCKAYWAENGTSDECDLSKSKEFGFIQNPEVASNILSTLPENFCASAKHNSSPNTFHADNAGLISDNEDCGTGRAPELATQAEADRIAAEAEADRIAAEAEADRIAAEAEADRIAAEAEADRIATIEKTCSPLKRDGLEWRTVSYSGNKRVGFPNLTHLQYIGKEACYRSWQTSGSQSNGSVGVIDEQGGAFYDTQGQYDRGIYRRHNRILAWYGKYCEGENGSRKYRCQVGGTHARTCQALNIENVPSFEECVDNGGYENPSVSEKSNPNNRAIINPHKHPAQSHPYCRGENEQQLYKGDPGYDECFKTTLTNRNITTQTLNKVECGTPNSVPDQGSCYQWVFGTTGDCQPGETKVTTNWKRKNARGGIEVYTECNTYIQIPLRVFAVGGQPDKLYTREGCKEYMKTEYQNQC
jgi:type IV pilus assembly protein PilA